MTGVFGSELLLARRGVESDLLRTRFNLPFLLLLVVFGNINLFGQRPHVDFAPFWTKLGVLVEAFLDQGGHACAYAFLGKGVFGSVEAGQFFGKKIVQDEAKGPDVNFFPVQPEHFLGQDDIFFELRRKVIVCFFEIPEFSFFLISDKERLPYCQSIVVDIYVTEIQSCVTFKLSFLCDLAHHRNKVFQQALHRVLSNLLTQFYLFLNVFLQCALVSD